MDRHSIQLSNDRFLTLSEHQVESIARGLGVPTTVSDGDPLVVEAVRSLPLEQRAATVAVALLRFGQKEDIESVSHHSGLSPWTVWQLEDCFLRAVAQVARRLPLA